MSEHEAIDRAVDRLRGQTTVQDRLDVLQELVRFWHGPIGPGDGIDDRKLAGIAMPHPLRWWYRWAGKRREILPPLLKPRQLEIADGLLRFTLDFDEDVYQWGTLPDGDDPPVSGRFDDGEPWSAANVRLSEHLILECLFEAVSSCAKYSAAGGPLKEHEFAEISKAIPPLGFSPWGSLELTFFAGNGAFMVASPSGPPDGGQACGVWIGAQTREPLQFLRPYLDQRWYRVRI
jgi:hypothetical protein